MLPLYRRTLAIDFSKMSKQSKYLLVALILIGCALRMPGLFGNRLHPDEALYSSLALDIHMGRDRLLLDQTVDKPPLLFFIQAVFFSLLGPSMWSARLPGLISSIVALPMLASLSWRIYRQDFVSVLSVALLSFSPLAVRFSPSAFLDPLLLLFLLGALLMSSDTLRTSILPQNPRIMVVCGLMYGLATATKHQAWFFLPLLVIWAVLSGWRRREWMRFLIGAVPIWAVLALWDLLGNGRIDLWQEQLSSYGGLRLSWSWELWSRLDLWSAVWGVALNSPLLSFAMLLAIPPFIALLIQNQDRYAAIDQSILMFVMGYFILHWFVAIPAWGRYLLPVLPIAFMMIARYFWRVIDFAQNILMPDLGRYSIISRFTGIWVLIFIGVLLPTTLWPSEENTGFDEEIWAKNDIQVITDVLAEAPYGTVLYDHWYSWIWRYYLYDSRVFVSWFPHPDGLKADLVAFGREPGLRYLVLPGGAEAKPVIRSVQSAGFRLIPVELDSSRITTTGPRLYKIEPI